MPQSKEHIRQRWKANQRFKALGNRQNRLINQIKVKMKNHVALSADVINYYTYNRYFIIVL
jgi:hypothetical protein